MKHVLSDDHARLTETMTDWYLAGYALFVSPGVAMPGVIVRTPVEVHYAPRSADDPCPFAEPWTGSRFHGGELVCPGEKRGPVESYTKEAA